MSEFKINGREIKSLLKKGKELSEHEKQFEFLRRSYVGGEEYREGKYLIKHKREFEKSYKRRLDQAVYTNYVSPVVDVYNGYLHRERIKRENRGINKTLYNEYILDADLNGTSHESFMREVSLISSIFGCVGILIDNPINSKGNLGVDISNGLHTYSKIYTPENIINMIYSFDTGRPVLDIVVLEEDFEDSFNYYVIYTQDSWYRVKRKGSSQPVLISRGEHRLGIVPFILHKNKSSALESLGTSDIIDIAELNKRVYQLDSSALEIIENTAFPFLEMPKVSNIGGNEEEVVIGTTNVLEYDAAETPSGAHRWIEPSGQSLDKILNWRNQSLEDIRYHSKIGGTDSTSSRSAESGVSLEIRFQQLNSILSEKAESLENTENAIFWLLGLWNNMSWEGKVEYSRKFGVKDLAFELDQILKSKNIISSKTFDKEISKRVAGKILVDTEEDIINKISEESAEGPSLNSVNLGDINA